MRGYHRPPVDRRTWSDVADVLSERHVPFVIVTGYRRETLPAVLREAPYIAKPFNEAELIDVVNSTCG